MVEQDTCFSEETLDVDQAKNWDLFFHSTTYDDILAEVIKLLKCRVFFREHTINHLICLKIVVEVEYSHLPSDQIFKALFCLYIDFECAIFGARHGRLETLSFPNNSVADPTAIGSSFFDDFMSHAHPNCDRGIA